MKALYLILGILLSFNITLKLVEDYQFERDITTTKLQSLQSCYFSAVKLGAVDPTRAEEFCLTHSKETTENYRDISRQMEYLTDQQYSLSNFYTSKFKKIFSTYTLKTKQD